MCAYRISVWLQSAPKKIFWAYNPSVDVFSLESTTEISPTLQSLPFWSGERRVGFFCLSIRAGERRVGRDGAERILSLPSTRERWVQAPSVGIPHTHFAMKGPKKNIFVVRSFIFCVLKLTRGNRIRRTWIHSYARQRWAPLSRPVPWASELARPEPCRTGLDWALWIQFLSIFRLMYTAGMGKKTKR